MKKQKLTKQERRELLFGKPNKATGRVAVLSLMAHWNNDSECHCQYKKQ